MLFTKELIEELLINEIGNDIIEMPKNGEKKKFAFFSPFVNDTERKCVMWFPSGRFRCYKSGTEGNLFLFLQLIKGFSNIAESKYYFLKTYLKTKDLKNLFYYQKDSNDLLEDKDKKDSIFFPDHYKNFNKLKHIEYYNYLLNREISLEKIKKINLKIDEVNKRIIFPIYTDDNKKLIYYTGRSIIKDEKIRWLDAKVPNKNSIFFEIEKSQKIYIVEGIFDALKIDGGFSLLGCYLNEEVYKKIITNDYYKIIVVMDNDLPGLEAQINIALKLKNTNKNIFIWDWNNLLIEKYKDFGEIPLSLLNTIKDSNYYKFDDKGKLKWTLLNLRKFDDEKKKKINKMIKYGIV